MRRSIPLVPLLALAGCVLITGKEPGSQDCPTGQVRFTPDGDLPADLTTTFESTGPDTPANYTLDRPGTLAFCGGTYYAVITVSADDATITGFEADKAVLSGADANRIVHHTGAGTLTLTDLVFEHGSADDGGAVLSDTGDVTATGCDFDQNAASFRGGAVAALGGAVGATGSTFTNNEAAGFGGAIYVSGALTLQDDTLDSNRCVTSASCAGGALHAAPGGDPVTITGTTVSKSTSRNVGGGLWSQGRAVTVTDSTFSENRSEVLSGGGMTVNDGTVDLTNTVFEGNQAIGDDGGAAYFTDTEVTCIRTSGRGGFYSNDPGVAFLSLGRTLTSTGCDWGEGTEDNTGYDLRLIDSGGGTTDETFGDDASFTCDDTTCTPQ